MEAEEVSAGELVSLGRRGQGAKQTHEGCVAGHRWSRREAGTPGSNRRACMVCWAGQQRPTGRAAAAGHPGCPSAAARHVVMAGLGR